jgi:arylsulfatase A-like enzyme
MRMPLAIGLIVTACLSASPAPRPNILFILTDDQTHRSVSGYAAAHPWVETPHLDELSRRGVRFNHAYVGTWCMPARVSLLTGRMPHAVESVRMEGPYPGVVYDPAQTPFWPRVLRGYGYTTAHIGKWHCGADTGAGRDWDYQAAWLRPARADDPGGTSYYLDQRISFDGGPARHVPGYATDNYTDWADAFVRGGNRPSDRPWFLWLCYTAPHHPFVPADRHRYDYLREEAPVPSDLFPPRPGKPAYMQRIREWEPGEDGVLRSVHGGGFPFEEGLRDYHRSVRSVDEGVGRLMRALAETGQAENTLVIFTSDQGYAWGQHGFLKKVAPYDANLRAPLIVSHPGRIPAGREIESPVGGLDLIPTLFAWAGFELPWRMHGRDLSPLLEGALEAWPHPVGVSYTGWTYGKDTAEIPAGGMDGHSQVSGVPWYFLLREGSYKYVRTYVAGEAEELYDLARDPEELENLADDPAQRTRLLAMRAKAMDELRRTEAPFVGRLPAVRSPAN